MAQFFLELFAPQSLGGDTFPVPRTMTAMATHKAIRRWSSRSAAESALGAALNAEITLHVLVRSKLLDG